MAVNSFVSTATAPEQLSLDRLGSLMAAGQVESVVIKEKSNVVVGELVSGVLDGGATNFETPYPDDYEGELTARLLGTVADVQVDVEKASFWQVILGTFLPYALIFGVFIFILMRMQGGGNRVMSFGKARAKQVSRDQPKVTFKDVAGLEEAVEELQEIKEFLAKPQKFRAMGAKIPKGVLLFGPPGTGKTLLARAVAGEAGVPFFSISGSDFVEMFVGVGASRVRDLFEQAKAQAPAIIFVDEIDAVGRHRGAGLGGGHDEREQTLNQLLVEMDGFDVNTGVILIAGTNRPDILDPALLRPGRFDRQIMVDRPDLKGREAILRVHAKGKPLAEGIDLAVLARQTPGFTGADLANLINESALLAARFGRSEIGQDELEEAVSRVIAGPERRSMIITDEDKRITAYHEGGHALVGFALPNADPVHKATIIPRGRSLGHTLSLPTEERLYMRRSEMVDKLAMMLGGRTAEEIVFIDPTAGATSDIKQATELARRMVMEWGMSDRLGPMKYGEPQGEVFLGRDYAHQRDFSDEVASIIDEEIRLLITRAHDEARAILSKHREALDRLAAALIERETLDESEIRAVLHDVAKWQHVPNGTMRIQEPEANGSQAQGIAASLSEEHHDR
ncbi:MAG: ATP-dependent zinc metalloprotease FtsH [Actinobacteria bacterium]|nr:ATP-dependent zinc metalloprotease FtsH [Actinomycetota bacterium]MBU1494527.1 ATP-dependent zinc metalloprotease FtsH [Actinomycetota bacterium]MBU1865143.1 ATP-dependent zinc metalloprotease FtsH [Actinomycetota bacterium]